MENKIHWISVHIYETAEVNIYHYTDRDIESFDEDVERWLIEEKNCTGDIEWMCMDSLRLTIE